MAVVMVTTYPGGSSLGELCSIVDDPLRCSNVVVACGDTIVEPGRAPGLWSIQVSRRGNEEWEAEGEREEGREGGETEAGKGERESKGKRGMVAGKRAKSKSSFLLLPNLFLYPPSHAHPSIPTLPLSPTHLHVITARATNAITVPG